jgi:transcriptional regulator GlxA family with amidase domain
VRERVVRDGPVITAAGVSAGLDLGVVLADELAGRDIAEAMVLAAEYAPKPLLTGGTPDTARPEVRSWLEHTLGEFVAQVQAIPVAKEGA